MTESTATEQPAGESLTDSLAAAFDQYDQAPEEETTEAVEPVEVAEEPAEEPPEEPAEEITEETSEEPNENTLEAPQNWASEDREMFASLPPDAQQFLLNRHKSMEGDYTRKAQEVAQLREYADVHEMFRPYEQSLRQQGLSPSALIQQWAQTAQALESDPQAAITQLAEAYGVELGKSEEKFNDPQVSKLQQELQTLKQSMTQREQAEMQARQSSVLNDIRTFAEQKTEAGEPAHPYFDDVMNEVIALARAERAEGREPKLQDLYDKAVWMNPSVRDKVLSAQRQAAEKKRQEEARQKAAKAKTASKSVTGSPGGQSPVASLSIREQLERAL